MSDLMTADELMNQINQLREIAKQQQEQLAAIKQQLQNSND